MRGKTNVGSAGGHIINGIKKDCIVRGQEILKGDFVTVYDEPDAYRYTNITDYPYCVKKINDDVILICNNSTIFLVNAKTGARISTTGFKRETNNAIVSRAYSVGENLFVYLEGSASESSDRTLYKVRARLFKVEGSKIVFFDASQELTVLSRVKAFDTRDKFEIHDIYNNFEDGRIVIAVNTLEYSGNDDFTRSYFLIKIKIKNESVEEIRRITGDSYSYMHAAMLNGGNCVVSSSLSSGRYYLTIWDLSTTASQLKNYEVTGGIHIPIKVINGEWEGISVKSGKVFSWRNISNLIERDLNIETDTTFSTNPMQKIRIGILGKSKAIINYKESSTSKCFYRILNMLNDNAPTLSTYKREDFPYYNDSLNANFEYLGEYSDNFIIAEYGAYNNTDSKNNIIIMNVKIINNEIVDATPGNNIATLANNSKYISGVANKDGIEGDTIQVVVSQYEMEKNIGDSIENYDTEFVINHSDGHLYVEIDENDPYMYEINAEGHLIASQS